MTESLTKKCRICSTAVEESTLLKNGKIHWHCNNCFFTGLDPDFFLNLEDEKSRYDLHENTSSSKGYIRMFEDFIDYAITPYQDSVRTILDYGSGPEPILAQLLEQKGYEVEFYDPIYANKDLSNKKFDLVCSTEAFEHFYNPIKEIQTIKGLLKPDSYLVIMTRFMVSREEFKSWSYKNDSSHVSFYDLKTFDYITEKYKLKVLKTDQFKNIVLANLE